EADDRIAQLQADREAAETEAADAKTQAEALDREISRMLHRGEDDAAEKLVTKRDKLRAQAEIKSRKASILGNDAQAVERKSRFGRNERVKTAQAELLARTKARADELGKKIASVVSSADVRELPLARQLVRFLEKEEPNCGKS